MPSDRPIIFSGPMVRALLEERKTQTRRVLKPQPTPILHCKKCGRPEGKWAECPPENYPCNGHVTTWSSPKKMPYAIGDRLWVRETWADVNTSQGPGLGYRADNGFIQPEFDGPDYGAGPSYNYDKYPGTYSMWFEDLLAGAPDHRWRSPIHMPRWASRLTLTVTDVRVERLQDISEADAIAEGIALAPHPRPAYRVEVKTPNHLGVDAVDADKAKSCFMRLWQTIHGPDAWDTNPWVVALTFTVDQRNIDEN